MYGTKLNCELFSDFCVWMAGKSMLVVVVEASY